eukprot:622294_1
MSNSDLMPAVIQAIQKLTRSATSPFIVISEAENTVMKRIGSNLNTLKELRTELDVLQRKYPQSVTKIRNQKLNQIETAYNKVNQTFDAITNALNKKRQGILNELNDLKAQITPQSVNGTECKRQMDLLASSLKNIDISTQYLSQTLNECKSKIKSQTMTNRKEDVMSMGQKSNETFNITENEVDQVRDHVQSIIDSNNNARNNVEFVMNTESHNVILAKVNDIGVLNVAMSAQQQQISIIKPDVEANIHKRNRKRIRRQVNDVQQEEVSSDLPPVIVRIKHEEMWGLVSTPGENSNIDLLDIPGHIDDTIVPDIMAVHEDCFRHNTESNMEASIVFDIENPYHTEAIVQCNNTPSESGCSTTVPLELYHDQIVDDADDNTIQSQQMEANTTIQNGTEKEENTPDRPTFVCRDCHKRFKYNSHLIQHMEQVHIFSKGPVELVPCRKCRMMCASQDLLAHVNAVHPRHRDYYTLYIKSVKQIQRREEMIYGCDFSNCCMRFSRRASLAKHQ